CRLVLRVVTQQGGAGGDLWGLHQRAGMGREGAVVLAYCGAASGEGRGSDRRGRPRESLALKNVVGRGVGEHNGGVGEAASSAARRHATCWWSAAGAISIPRGSGRISSTRG